MQVILLERIGRLGQMGDVVKVRPGFARNFLLPQGKALRATKENLSRFEFALHRFEARAIFGRGAQRLAARQEEIAGKAVFDADDVAHLAESSDPFEQDHFHGALLSGSRRAAARETARV